MKNAQKQTVRVVSKSEYAVHIGAKTYLGLVGAGLCLLCLLCIVGIVVLFVEGVDVPFSDIPVLLTLVGVMASGAWFVLRLGVKTVRAAKDIAPVLPMTRANTGHLPAPDSLVRASKAPAHAQKTILLRATGNAQEEPEEHLLRAAEGQE